MDSTNTANNTQGSSTAVPPSTHRSETPSPSRHTNDTGGLSYSPSNPANLRWSPGKWFRYSSLNRKKKMIIKPLNNQILEVQLDDFLDKLLPSMPQGVILNNVMDELRKKKVLIGDRWSDFPLDPESRTKDSESVAFNPLGSIFESVVAAAKATCTVTGPTCSEATRKPRSPTTKAADGRQLVQNYTFVLNPHAAESSITRPDGFMIDIDRYLQLTSGTRPVSWYDITFPGEWILNDAFASDRDIDNNVAKEVFTLQNIMELDPRRRFVLGMTIKNRTSTLWFWSRGAIMVSQSFDLISEPEKLARIFISLAFADEVDMGWDPTISVTEVCNQDGTITRMYDIRVGDTVYKTSKILFDAPVPKTLGRATRVFEATDPQGRTCVVKDAWMREDCSMEYQIQEDMLTAVEKKFDADAVERVRRHLITVTSSWAVEVRDGVRDHTTEVMMRGGVPRILGDLYLQERSRTEPNLERWSMEHRYTISATETQCEWDMAHPVHRRIHVRNVYKELAVPMTRMPCMFIEVFPILHDIVQALYFIHRSGWIHRDISTRNIYLYVDQQAGGQARGLLGDFEYAKAQIEPDGASGFISAFSDQRRTGTTAFMSSEVVLQWYSSVPRSPRFPDIGADPLDDFEIYKRRREELKERLSHSPPTPPFRNNFLHDLESVWWIAILALYNNDDVDNRSNNRQICDRRRYVWDRLFPQPFQGSERTIFFENPSWCYSKAIEYLPQDFHKIARHLAHMSISIRLGYVRAEVLLPESLETLTDKTTLHKDILAQLTVLQEEAEAIVPARTMSISRKRKDAPSSEDIEPQDRQSDVHVDKKSRMIDEE